MSHLTVPFHYPKPPVVNFGRDSKHQYLNCNSVINANIKKTMETNRLIYVSTSYHSNRVYKSWVIYFPNSNFYFHSSWDSLSVIIPLTFCSFFNFLSCFIVISLLCVSLFHYDKYHHFLVSSIGPFPMVLEREIEYVVY